MTHEVTIPEIGESITEALILRWIKVPGDPIGRDEPLVELETDKVTVEMPSPVAGVLSEIVAAEGETVPVGGLIARIEEGAAAGAAAAATATMGAQAHRQEENAQERATEPAAIATVGAQTNLLAGANRAVPPAAAPAPATTAPPPAEAPAPAPEGGGQQEEQRHAGSPPVEARAPAPPPAGPAASTTAGSLRIMPAARPLIAEHALDAGAIPATGKGGRLLKSDVLAYLAAREAEAGQQEPPPSGDSQSSTGEPPVPGTPPPTGELPAAGMPSPAATMPAAGATPPAGEPPVPGTPSATAAAPAGASPAPRPATPAARTQPDPASAAAPSAARAEERVAMTPIRRRIAERLVQSQQQAALLTTFNEIDMSAVKDFRKQYRNDFEQRHDVRLGFLSFFVKAAVDALRRFPRLNAEISGSDIVYRNYHDIGIAVSTDRGLMVPVLRSAERMSFAGIEGQIADFAGRARKGRIRLDELQGGTFTITNGGIFGSLLSTPIINPPQSGVLGLHAIQDRPMVVDGEIVVRPMMYVALTYDHRIVDGREAVSFLVRIKEAIQDPARMLIEV